jgi:hypothetical protein
MRQSVRQLTLSIIVAPISRRLYADGLRDPRFTKQARCIGTSRFSACEADSGLSRLHASHERRLRNGNTAAVQRTICRCRSCDVPYRAALPFTSGGSALEASGMWRAVRSDVSVGGTVIFGRFADCDRRCTIMSVCGHAQ